MADDLSPARFGTAFKAFMDAVVAESSPPRSPLLERIAAHLGTDPTRLPVIAEEFDSFEHPNVQVALEDYLGGAGRRGAARGADRRGDGQQTLHGPRPLRPREPYGRRRSPSLLRCPLPRDVWVSLGGTRQ